MTVRTIYVWGISFQIELSEGVDIYEGLRLKYPRIYAEVMKEEKAMRLAYQYGGKEEPDAVDEYNEDMYFAHMDYLEYIYES